jgi:hypothetical protein
MNTSANSILIKLKTYFVLSLALALLCLSGCGNSDDKAALLKCNIPWDQRTEPQKLIGSWCDGNYQPGSGRTIVSQTMKFQTMLCFYSDGTLKQFQISHSYLDSKSEMDNGTDVKVENGILTYKSSKFGEESYPIKISSDEIVIDGFISIGKGEFRKCE